MTAPETPADDADLPVDLEAAKKLRSENRNLRERLHNAEEQARGFKEQADALQEQYGQAAAIVTTMQHQEVERIAGEHLVEAADIWRAQPDLQAFYDNEFKTITADRVVETARALIADKPHLARPQKVTAPPTDRPVEGLRSGAAPSVTPTAPTWSSAIRGG